MERSRRLLDRWPIYYWRRYPLMLAANGFKPRLLQQIPKSAIQQALQLGYLRWTRALAPWCRGKDVIDVGCGMGLHGVGFLLEGAKTYVGIDPEVKPRSAVIKDQHNGQRVDCGWTPEQLMQACPRFEMIRGLSNQLEGKRTFDFAALHNATEHLTDLAGVLGSIRRLLRPGGTLVFNHHNWYCWNGHHQQPKTVKRIIPGDSTQSPYIDWAHLTTQHPPESYVMTKLNRHSMAEVRSITQAAGFEIQVWEPTRSTEEQGVDRLTDTIREMHPHLTEADFTTQNIFVVARLKS